MPQEYLVGKPSWAVPLITDPSFAKFGEVLQPKEKLKKGDIVFLGIPFQGMSPWNVNFGFGPEALRRALANVRPYSEELDIDITHSVGVTDLGDVEIAPMNYEETFRRTGVVLKEIFQKGWTPIIFGGSHTITEGTMRAFSDYYDRNVGLVWFDAHPDTMKEYNGDKHYDGCPLFRAIDDGYIKPENVVVLGVGGYQNAASEMRFTKELGVKLYTMSQIYEKGLDQTLTEAVAIAKKETKAFYTSIDIDVADVWLPGGLSNFELMKSARKMGLAGSAAFDVVDVQPAMEQVCRLAGAVVMEFIGGLLASRIRKQA